MLIPHALFIAASRSGGGGTDSDALAWQAAVVVAGGTVSGTQLGYVSALIAGLKADGAWTKLDRLWLYASENATQASIDLVARAAHTLVSSPIFTANHGYAGDGSAAYIDTGYKPSVNAVNYASNNACFGFNIRTAESRTAANYYFTATNNNTSACNGMRKNSGGSQYNFAVNCSGTGQFIGWNLGTQTGRFHIERTDSSNFALYQNTTQVQTGIAAAPSLPTSNFFVLAGNNGSGTAQNFTQAELSYFYLGASTIGASMDSRILAYLTSVGA